MGLSQHELALRAGLRREKVNRLENKGEDIWLGDICRLLEAVGLKLVVIPKPDGSKAAAPDVFELSRNQPAENFADASFIDASKAKILKWGKIPQ